MDKIVENKLKQMEETSDYRNVTRDDGLMLNTIIKAANYKNILEAGTSNGYSSICLAEATRYTQGHLTTIEKIPEIAEMAIKNFREIGLDKYITVVTDAPDKAIKNLEGPFDLVFLDDGEDYEEMLKIVDSKLLKRGGVFAVHNATFPKEMLKPLLDAVHSNENYQSIVFNTPHGLLIALKVN